MPILGAGIGLKPEHYQAARALPKVTNTAFAPWFEVHTENYFVDGGPRLDYLAAIREQHPISFHGVGASLGGEQLPEAEHLKQVKRLVDRFQPALISEHAVWSTHQQCYFAELLPMPKTLAALNQLVRNIDAYQNAVGQVICIENPTNYLPFRSDLDEPEFLVEAAQRAGCLLLLDVNNLYLSSQNCGLNASDYMAKIPSQLVGEIHIAGFDVDANVGDALLIDSHAAPVAEPVWQLLAQALQRFGCTPILLERDDNIPPFETLWQECQQAQAMLDAHCRKRAAG